MKKIMFVGRSEAGKTTLRQALNGTVLDYCKTQYIGHETVVIDTPGEYAETSRLARALALYSYEADVVGLLINATEPFSLYPPCVTSACNRPCIGIITKCDHKDADVPRARHWLELAGCKDIFPVSSYTGEGIWQLLNYLAEPGDVLPFKNEEEANKPRLVLSDKYGSIDKVGSDARRWSWSEEDARKAAADPSGTARPDPGEEFKAVASNGIISGVADIPLSGEVRLEPEGTEPAGSKAAGTMAEGKETDRQAGGTSS